MRIRDRLDRSKRKPSTLQQRIGFAFFWLLVVMYAYVTISGPNFNAESHLYLTFSMVDHQSVSIDPYHVRLGDESYFHGHYYSDKAPGMSLLALPVYAGLRALMPKLKGEGYTAFPHQEFALAGSTGYIRYAITYVVLIIPSAIFSILLWLFFMRLSGSRAWSLILAGTYGLGTVAFPYSTQYFSHQACAILIGGAFLLLYYRVRRADPSSLNLPFVALAGLLAGTAVSCEYPVALLVALLTGYLLLVSRHRLRHMIAFGVGAIPPATAILLYDTLAFGSPFTTGYNHVHSALYHSNYHGGLLGVVLQSIQPPSWNSIWQITFGTYRGLFVVCPVLLLFFVAIPFMWRHRDLRPELLLCVAAVGLFFLMDASRGVDQNGWSGGWSIASRHLDPMLPFMVLPMACALGNRAFRIALAALGTISAVIMTLSVTISGLYPFSVQNPLRDTVLQRLLHGETELTWGNLLGLHGLESLLPLVMVIALSIARIAWLMHNADQVERECISRSRTMTAPSTRY